MKTDLFLSTESLPRIEPAPIPLIKRKKIFRTTISSRSNSGSVLTAQNLIPLNLKWGPLVWAPKR